MLQNEYNDVINQFDVKIDPTKNDVNKIHEFLSVYQDRQINITFPSGIDTDVVRAIALTHDNAVFKCHISDLRAVAKLKEACEKFRFYFDFSFPASSWTALQEQIDLGVSEIYPFDDLLYDLDAMRSKCDDSGIKTRMMANVIQSTRHDRGKRPTDPIFRPEDMFWLADYIDTFEFYCKSDNSEYSWHKFGPLYRTYVEKGQWTGYLDEIVPDLSLKIPNWSLMPRYSVSRSYCGASCMRGGRCRRCHDHLSLANTFADKNVRIKREEN